MWYAPGTEWGYDTTIVLSAKHREHKPPVSEAPNILHIGRRHLCPIGPAAVGLLWLLGCTASEDWSRDTWTGIRVGDDKRVGGWWCCGGTTAGWPSCASVVGVWLPWPTSFWSGFCWKHTSHKPFFSCVPNLKHPTVLQGTAATTNGLATFDVWLGALGSFNLTCSCKNNSRNSHYKILAQDWQYNKSVMDVEYV